MPLFRNFSDFYQLLQLTAPSRMESATKMQPVECSSCILTSLTVPTRDKCAYIASKCGQLLRYYLSLPIHYSCIFYIYRVSRCDATAALRSQYLRCICSWWCCKIDRSRLSTCLSICHPPFLSSSRLCVPSKGGLYWEIARQQYSVTRNTVMLVYRDMSRC